MKPSNSGVLADGCFDPLHVGHIAYLRAASGLVERMEPLMVRIAPDAVIEAKARRCFQTQDERAETVKSLVSCMCCFTDTLECAVRDLCPRLLVKGFGWNGRLPQSVLDACAEVGTHIVFTATQTRTSTERLAHRDLGDENDRR